MLGMNRGNGKMKYTMDYNRLTQAKEKAMELLKFENDSQKIIDFIEKLEDAKYLSLSTVHKSVMWQDEGNTFQLIGKELIELLNKKVDERYKYLNSITAEDLIILPHEKEDKPSD